MNLWIVGKWIDDDAWEFQGVFDTEERAENACRGPIYFLAPAILNQEQPGHSVEWRGLRYPQKQWRDLGRT